MKCINKIKTLTVFSALLTFVPRVHAIETISLDIDTAYILSVDNSINLRISKFQLMTEKRKAILGAWSYAPTLDISMSDSKTVRMNSSDTSSLNVSSTLSIPISRGGRESLQKKIKALSLDIQGTIIAQSEDDIKDSCFQAFHKTHTLQMKIDALKKLQIIAENQYEIAEKEYELGKIREIDLVETQLSVMTLSQTIYETETELYSSMYELKKITGIDESVSLILETRRDETYGGIDIQSIVPELQAAALRMNIDILKTRSAVEESRLSGKITESTWKPDIDVDASVQLNGEKYPLQNPDYGIKLSLKFPFELVPLNLSIGFSSTPNMQYGRSYSASASSPSSLDSIFNKSLSDVSLSQALMNATSTEDDVLFQIEQLVAGYERIRKQQELLTKTMELQRRKVEILAMQLDIGKVTRADYLKGENELLNTQLDRLSGVLSLLQAERQIEKAAGINPGELIRFGVQNDE